MDRDSGSRAAAASPDRRVPDSTSGLDVLHPLVSQVGKQLLVVAVESHVVIGVVELVDSEAAKDVLPDRLVSTGQLTEDATSALRQVQDRKSTRLNSSH